MRGARADAECPRCGELQPPPDEGLATCGKCGLVFPPKEIQRPIPKRRELPALVPPSSLVIEMHGDVQTLAWTDNASGGALALGAALIVAPMVWMSMLTGKEKALYTVFLCGLAIYGLYQSRRRPRLDVARDRLRGSSGVFAYKDIRAIELTGDRVVAVLRDGVACEIARARDPKIVAYIGDLVTRQLDAAE